MIISVSNNKGGAGKSTTVNALANGLKNEGYNVLVVDLDSQRNQTENMNISVGVPTIAEVIQQKIDIHEAVTKTEQTDIIAADHDLTLIDFSDEFSLKSYLDLIKDEYDFILLDTTPTIDNLMINTFVAADKVLIPINPSYRSVDTLLNFIDVIDQVKRNYNSELEVAGILITQYDNRPQVNRLVKKDINEMGEANHINVYKTTIRKGIAVEEAYLYKQDIFSANPRSNVAMDYKAFVGEFLRKIKKEG